MENRFTAVFQKTDKWFTDSYFLFYYEHPKKDIHKEARVRLGRNGGCV